jgi:hypothetical protein
MRTTMIFLFMILAFSACTNNNTDGAAMGLKTGRDSTDNPKMDSAYSNPNPDPQKPDMQGQEMYNYADSSTTRSQDKTIKNQQ